MATRRQKLLGALASLGCGACSAPLAPLPTSPFQDDGPPKLIETIVREDYGREADSSFRGWRDWDSSSHEVTLSIGASSWKELTRHGPTVAFPTSGGFGSLDTWGTAFEFSYHGRVLEGEHAELWVGGGFGISGYQERRDFNLILPNGERVDDDVWADVLRLTVSARVDFPLGPVTAFLGGGGGWYELTFYEEDDSFFGGGEDIVSDAELGGFAMAGFDIHLTENFALRIEDQAHFVRFHDLSRFTPGNSELGGLQNIIQAGFVLRF